MDPYEGYWRALELEPGAGLDEIKRAYREQALTWHPDRFPYDEALRARCESRMREVNAAYEALRELAEGGLPPEASPAAEPDEAPAASEEAAAEPPAWVDHWFGPPRPAGPGHEASGPPADEPVPGWASMGRFAAALATASAALAALFVIPNQTSPIYWQAMRLIASPALAYAAAAAGARGVWELAMGLALLALALNPVLPVPMGLEDWRVFNGVTPLLLGGMWLWTLKRGRPE